MLDALMSGISLLSSGKVNTLWAGLIAGLWFTRKRWREGMFLFLGVAAGGALSSLLKLLFKQPRPQFAEASTWGFPSGHTMSTTVFTLLLAALLSRRAPGHRWVYYGIALLWMAGVGASRVYLGEHFTLDVWGGYFFGVLFVMGWRLAWG